MSIHATSCGGDIPRGHLGDTVLQDGLFAAKVFDVAMVGTVQQSRSDFRTTVSGNSIIVHNKDRNTYTDPLLIYTA